LFIKKNVGEKPELELKMEEFESGEIHYPKMVLSEKRKNRTRIQAILENYEEKKDLPCMGQRCILPDNKRGEMVTITFKEFIKKVEYIARGLQNIGLKKGDCVGIMSKNRPEWTIADVACSSLGNLFFYLYFYFFRNYNGSCL
jgi:long-subunit acyl-CoA synthetase (AMP-forming)